MDLDAMDHEPPMERAIELAEAAGERGDGPYGSVLVRDGDLVMAASNRTNTDDDLALHPELTLARRAASEFTPAECAATVMYTSTEPCAMCATGMAYAGLGGVVYSVSGERAAEVRGGGEEGGGDEEGGGGDEGGGSEEGGGSGIPCTEVFERHGADVAVAGPVLEEAGLAVHRRFYR